KNPFIILIEKNAEPEIFQLPTSVYLINNDLFIPAEYSVSLLQKAYGGEIKFETSVNQARLVVKERKETEIPAPTVIGIPDEKLKDLDYSGAGITGISLEEKANGTLVRVNSEKKIKTYKSTFINGVLTIIFRNVTADIEKIKNASPAGLIKEIKARNINGDTEFQFKVEKDYATNEVISAGTGNDLLITIYSSAFSKKDSDPDKFNGRSKWDFNVIVIDPGHGGKDYGAIGINGVKEKDVNLGIALKLGEMIKKNIKDLKVIYTRSSDSFVELYRRGQIANEKDGKLFISIHCNSTPKKNPDANGFEIYLLRPGRTQEAIQIAERENSVIEFEENPERYQKLTDENFILVSMAQSSYMRYSEKFSGILNDAFSKDLSLSSRGVKQAGFYVLVGASMPGVLIESGFLSNKEDAAFLKSDKGQEQIAESIFDAVKKYKEDYEAVVKSGL
ncbi:MAG TPA: N-acetylmuramoyl-L-alanine amidase, partial [Ignavibacteriaceae bacterium]|nr:N-acetylmuramoyl-L-alanine amidase [Ignavibacteriaceae bacterium]